MKPKVLIICTGNSMRSQIAEAVLRDELGDLIEVYSAGTHPGYVHPMAISTLREIGIDTKTLRSKSINVFLEQEIDLVITVCDHAREACPYLPGAKKTIHKGYADPMRYSNNDNADEMFAKLRDRMRRELREIVVKELDLSV
jgi:arsenate reductase (thioredoxin)